VARIGGAHHVLGVELLLGELGHSEGSVLLGATAGEGREADHEEVETGEGDEVHSKLTKISVELAREAKAAGDAGHGSRYKVVEVTIGGGGELEGAEADVVEGFVVEAEAFVCVFYELVHTKGSIVGLNDSVADFWRRAYRVSGHDSVGVLLTDLGDEEGAHASASTATKRVGDLKALQAVARLRFLADHVKDGVDELGTFGVVSLGPIVTSAGLPEDEIVGAEKLAEWASTDRVHGAGLEVHEYSTGDVAAASGLVEIDINALELKIRVTVVGASRVNAVLIRDYFPELGTDLVTTLAGLDVYEFTHCVKRKKEKLRLCVGG